MKVLEKSLPPLTTPKTNRGERAGEFYKEIKNGTKLGGGFNSHHSLETKAEMSLGFCVLFLVSHQQTGNGKGGTSLSEVHRENDFDTEGKCNLKERKSQLF